MSSASGNYDESSDLEAARQGSPAAFSRLYETHAPALHLWATFRIRPALRGRIDPEDVVQETWCRAFRLIPKYPPETPFRAWLFRIANLVLFDLFKRARPTKASALEATDKQQALANLPEDATAISKRAARIEHLLQFLAATRDLDDADRELLLLRGLEGRSHEEVSAKLGIEPATLRKRWQRLRDRLDLAGAVRILTDCATSDWTTH